MSLWEELFSARFVGADLDQPSVQRRLERLELTLEALIQLLRLQSNVDGDELRQMIARVDLLDGREDEAIGTELFRLAPRCYECNLPLNVRRDACVYCGTGMKEARKKRAARPVPKVRCRQCGASVPEDGTYFTGHGLACGPCFHDPNRHAGHLALAEAPSEGELSLRDDGGGLSDPDS